MLVPLGIKRATYYGWKKGEGEDGTGLHAIGAPSSAVGPPLAPSGAAGPGLRMGGPRVMALLATLCTMGALTNGVPNHCAE